MTPSLENRIGIVTGAAKGMGREICLALAGEGAHLALAAREAEPLLALGREIEAVGRRALVQPTDVTDEAAVSALVERTLATLGGRIDILVSGSSPERMHDEYVEEMALRRVTTARDIANAVVFLASDASRNMTGQSMTVDGGWDV